MKKSVLCSLLLAASFTSLFAGGLVTNTNHSAAFLRNPARMGSLELDAVYYNPAGVAFLEKGFHLGLNNQSAFQSRNVTATIQENTFVPPATMQNRLYEGKIASPVIPSIHFAYVSDRWSVSSHFGVPGGGGKLDYANGLPMFDVMVRQMIFGNVYQMLVANEVPAAAAQAYQTAGDATVNSAFSGQTYLFGWQLGGTYKLTENLSAYAGARLLMAKAKYEGSVYYAFSGQENSMELLTEQSGFSIAPIVGLDYKFDRLNLALKYEFGSNIEVENMTSSFPTQFNEVAALARFKDGVKSQSDQPALLTAGAAYDLTVDLKLSAGIHYYFDKNTDYNGLEDEILSNTVEYLLGAEYALSEKLTLSAGVQFTNYDLSDNYNSNTGFMMSSYSLGAGLKYSPTDYLDLNLGVLWTNFDDYNKTANYNGIGLLEQYERKSTVAGIGVNWSF
ncbi:long-chain fatty acid transport protein [Porphyromonadaceae bacterium KHP3R9]|nr:long-chain fatty acid transport protein [Porphyromonadaceae bacterium KHP3R9]